MVSRTGSTTALVCISAGLFLHAISVPAASGQCGPAWAEGFGVPGNGLNDAVQAMVVWDDGTGPALYVGGWFTNAGGNPANHIAKWDGILWTPLGSGTNGSYVSALAVWDDGSGEALYVGGHFDNAGGVPANYIAKWDGSNWTALGTGMSAVGSAPTVRSLAVFEGELYAGGDFNFAGGVGASRIAHWDGGQWYPCGSGMQGNQTSVYALKVWDDGGGQDLYAGGFFHVQGNFIARWSGTSWSTLGVGMDSSVYALEVFDDGTGEALYAGGYFFNAGGVSVNRIARWKSGVWSPVGSGADVGVLAFAIFDDGGGPALYAGGFFNNIGGVSTPGIGKWNGAWSAVGGGMGGSFPWVYAFAPFGGGLYAGGTFSGAGGVPSSQIALWAGGAGNPCDTNCDGSVNPFDVQPFVELLAGGSACSGCAGDTNGDGSTNAFDIQPFIECLGG